jgi:hypothetical protein
MFEVLRSGLLSRIVAKISSIESSGTVTDPDIEGDGNIETKSVPPQDQNTPRNMLVELYGRIKNHRPVSPATAFRELHLSREPDIS